MEKVKISIRPLKKEDWDMAMQLAWDTFLIYEAVEYSEEGVKNFHEFVKGEELKRLFLLGEYEATGAFSDDVIVGILGVRNKTHISLLFVESKYHHQGIASSMMKELFYVKQLSGYKEMTVNSSPYAKDFYHKLGFVDTNKELTTDGIRYTPMVIEL